MGYNVRGMRNSLKLVLLVKTVWYCINDCFLKCLVISKFEATKKLKKIKFFKNTLKIQKQMGFGKMICIIAQRVLVNIVDIPNKHQGLSWKLGDFSQLVLLMACDICV